MTCVSKEYGIKGGGVTFGERGDKNLVEGMNKILAGGES